VRRQILLSSNRKAVAVVIMLMLVSSPAHGQTKAETSVHDDILALQKQVSEMKSLMEELRAELLRARAETVELRQALQETQGAHASAHAATGEPAPETVQRLEEEQQLLNAKVEEQYQTKVESASKYRVRLNGIVLMNLFGNRGAVDNLDFPTLALEEDAIERRGGFGGSLRQSLLGFEVFGPQVKGARISADAEFDFAGGFPDALDGVTFGLPRLRTGVMRMIWPKTTVAAGQDVPFFSPLSPSSFASLAVPGLAYSGNLWTWTPQLRVEHHLDLTSNSDVLLQGGILDPLTGEPPTSQFFRTPQAGEASRQPAYATRIAWNRRTFGRQLALGMGGYYSRQDWNFHRNVVAWAGSSDWIIPVGNRWELSGEFYRGRGLGGLGGGIGRSAVLNGPVADPATQVRGLQAIGGWAQLKFRQTEKLEWNGAFGQDNAFASDLRLFPFRPPQNYFDASITRNRSSFVNFIYRPRSDLLFSLEYRRLRTSVLQGNSEAAGQINLSMGVLF
jgi:hypothetical protein